MRGRPVRLTAKASFHRVLPSSNDRNTVVATAVHSFEQVTASIAPPCLLPAQKPTRSLATVACDVPPCIGSVRDQPTQPTPPGTNRPAGTPGVLAARAPVTAVRCASERAPVRGHPRAKSILKPALNSFPAGESRGGAEADQRAA